MKNNLFYNSIVFRLAGPVLFGILVYILVLMFFDSVDMLIENFFSREVLFVVCLTFLSFESNRLVLVLHKRIFISDKIQWIRIGIQFLSALILSITLITCSLHLYFRYIEGFTTITTELITFNIIYGVISLFYHLHYFSILFLSKKNEKILHNQVVKKQELEHETEKFKNLVTADFLFESLEIIITEVHNTTKNADQLVELLAQTYRYALDHTDSELVSINREIEALKQVCRIFETKYKNMISTEIQISEGDKIFVIPGLLQIIFEQAVIRSIITPALPFRFSVFSKKKHILIRYTDNPKVSNYTDTDSAFEQIGRTYSYFYEGETGKIIKNGEVHLTIPLLEIEEE